LFKKEGGVSFRVKKFLATDAGRFVPAYFSRGRQRPHPDNRCERTPSRLRPATAGPCTPRRSAPTREFPEPVAESFQSRKFRPVSRPASIMIVSMPPCASHAASFPFPLPPTTSPPGLKPLQANDLAMARPDLMKGHPPCPSDCRGSGCALSSPTPKGV